MLDEGIRLAAGQARSVCMVEREAYLAALLVKRMQEGSLAEAPIWSDVTTFDGRPWCGVVDLITGGYPCQPFSQIGKRGGKTDPRHIWPDIARIINEVKPRACFFENVPNHLSLGFEQVNDELESMGFDVAAGLFSAEEVGASQPRERLFILAVRRGERLERYVPFRSTERTTRRGGRTEVEAAIFPPGPNSDDKWRRIIIQRPYLAPSFTTQEASESMVLGVAHGLTSKLDIDKWRQLNESRLSDLVEIRRSQEVAKINNPRKMRRVQGNEGLTKTPSGHREPAGFSRGVVSEASHRSRYEAWEMGEGNNQNETLYCLPEVIQATKEQNQSLLRSDMPQENGQNQCYEKMASTNRVDRLRACGNGVVPLAVAYAWVALVDSFYEVNYEAAEAGKEV
jgi:site-specific DNA-cytosine methylase